MYFSVHKFYFSVHKYISQCTNVFLSAQMYFSVPGYMVFPRISVARLGHFALVICLANRSAFENILIQHRKACFVLAVALKCKFPFHFVLVVAGALKVLMTQIAFHAVKNVGRETAAINSRKRASSSQLTRPELQITDHKFSQTMHRGYVLAYPDSRIAKKMPRTSDEFVLSNYKDWLGRPYSRINLYLSPIERNDIGESDGTASEVEIIDWSELEHDINFDNISLSLPEMDNSAVPELMPLIPQQNEDIISTADLLFVATDFLKVVAFECFCMHLFNSVHVQESLKSVTCMWSVTLNAYYQ